MAPRDDQGWRRLREREDLEEEEQEKLRDEIEQRSGAFGGRVLTEAEMGRIEELFERVEPLIEQVNTLYRAFAMGTEKRPPVERRSHLDRTMQTLSMMPKPTQALQFRYNTLNSRYATHKERWEKLLREVEAGKFAKKKS